MLRTHNTARIFYFMKNNTNFYECFCTTQNFDIKGYNRTNKSLSEIPLSFK